ncbi:MAG: ATP-binding protein, partial [Anaerolineales bacterium]|nr:ATP-binding protein [Anaerolineales bacterium]
MLIDRPQILAQMQTAVSRSRVVTLVGPRQSGKTTLARQFVAPDSINYFDLEDPISLARLEQPMTALRDLRGLVVIDEVQRRPDLFPILRVLVDRMPLPATFLVLGSASPELLRQSAESLAGRIEIITLMGFDLAEVGSENQASHWRRGGFPLSYLASTEADSVAWRKNFVQTLLERDLPQMGIGTPAPLLLRFWTMLAHYHGQVLNAAELARSLGISGSSVRRYLDLLEQVFMVRQLQPWHANLKKRQV